MAGCGLSEDTVFSSFFYNYGSSWETPSNQVRGGSGPGGVVPAPPAAGSLGTRRGGRGSGGGGEDGGPSGSHCLGQRQPASGGVPLPPMPALQSPGSVASLPSPFCHRHLPPPPPSPAGTRGRGRSWRVTPNNSRQNQGTRAQPSRSRRGRRAPVRPAPASPPLAPRGCGAARPPPPETCCPAHSPRARSHLFP